ncbi:MAG: cell division protein SepF [Actinomycetota bacterium]|nr:cell division protein SepF [Actinomycetota bacterium]
MSMLHRLKAYFGMVPAEELDGYDPDYDPDGEAGHRTGYDDHDHDEEARYGAGYEDEAIDGVRRRPYTSERAAPRRPRQAAREDYDGPTRYGRTGDGSGGSGYAESEVTSLRPTYRPGWSAEAAPVCGALAVDATAALREHVREPPRGPVPEPTGRTCPPLAEDGRLRPRIVTLLPRTYNEARTIGEHYREGTPVIMDLTEMDDAGAKRLVDFAAGLAFALRGSIDKVTTKVFLLSPADVAVSVEDRRRIAKDGISPQS